MSKDKDARLNRLLNNGRCLDIALDHGVCNEPSFLNGLEDMPQVMDKLVAAAPDAIQLNYGQADLLQDRPGSNKPALVMRLDMGNPYNATAHRVMWAVLQNEKDPVLPAIQRDAACVVVNLFMLPNEPELFRQCVQNIARVRADCDRYGMPLMIEPLVMRPHSDQGGYMVDGDAEKIVTLVRLAREMGADIVKADPTSDPGFPPRGAGRALPRARARRRARRPAAGVRAFARADGPGRRRHGLWTQRIPARQSVSGGQCADGHDPPRRERRGGLGHLRIRRRIPRVNLKAK